MQGNLSEWCADVFDGEAYSKGPQAGPLDLSLKAERVHRGGNFEGLARDCRSAGRYHFGAKGESRHVGFRVARNVPAGERRAGLSMPKPVTALDDGDLAEAPQAVGVEPAPAPEGPTTATASGGGSASARPEQPAAPATSDDSPAGRLKARGLTRSGSYLVVASEAGELERLRKARPMIDALTQSFARYAAVLQNEAMIAEAEEARQGLDAQINAAGAAAAKFPSGIRANSADNQSHQAALDYRNGLIRQRDQVAATADALRSQAPSAEQKEGLVKDLTEERAEFLKAASELKPACDKVQREYRALQNDPAVKDALAALRASKEAAFLGPSKEFQKAYEAVTGAERATSPETAAPRRKRPTPRR